MKRKGYLPKIEQQFSKMYSFADLKFMKNATSSDLKAIIAECNAIKEKAKKERDNNPDYVDAKEMMKPIQKMYSDTCKFQDTKSRLALYLLHNRGDLDIGDLPD